LRRCAVDPSRFVNHLDDDNLGFSQIAALLVGRRVPGSCRDDFGFGFRFDKNRHPVVTSLVVVHLPEFFVFLFYPNRFLEEMSLP
jgi:hypothetical protein